MTRNERWSFGAGSNFDVRKFGTAVPARLERGWTQDFPAVSIGDIQRKTPVRELIRKFVHPLSTYRASTQYRVGRECRKCGQPETLLYSQGSLGRRPRADYRGGVKSADLKVAPALRARAYNRLVSGVWFQRSLS